MPSTNNLYAGMLSKLGQIAVPAVLVTGILICLGCGSSDDGEAVENKKPVAVSYTHLTLPTILLV